jgi:hypothetical protein
MHVNSLADFTGVCNMRHMQFSIQPAQVDGLSCQHIVAVVSCEAPQQH